MKMQMYLIYYVLEPIGKQMERLSKKVKTGIFLLGGASLFFLFFLNASTYEFPRYIFLFTAGCFAMVLMILSTMPSSFQKVKLDKVLGFFWFGAGAFILLSGLIYNLANLSDAIMFLIVYPLTWFVWCQKPFSEIFQLLSRLCIGSFIAFLVISVLFFPIHQSQYSGLISNANETAAYLSLVFACLLVELLELDHYSVRFWMELMLLGIAATLIFYTNSRTGQLACIVVFVVVSVLHLYNYRAQWKRRVVKQILPVVVSFLVFLPTTVYMFQGVHWVTKRVVHTVTDHIFMNESASLDIEQQEEDQELYDIRGFFEKNKGKTSGDGKSLDQISTGRLSIWAEFAKHVRLFGTNESLHFYVEGRDAYYSTAHNTPLEYAVCYGVFCGILYFLFNIFAGLKALRFAVKESKCRYSFLPVAVTMAFGVCSMLGSLKTPFAYILTMYYFFVQMPLMFQITSDSK